MRGNVRYTDEIQPVTPLTKHNVIILYCYFTLLPCCPWYTTKYSLNLSNKQSTHFLHIYHVFTVFYSLLLPPQIRSTTIYRSLGLFNFSFPVFLYFFLPDDHGLYPCFRMWLICLFMVRKNKAKKYNKRMGQNTGTSKILKRERKMEMATALAAESLAKRKRVARWKREKNVSAPEHTNSRFDKPRQSPKRHHRATRTLTKT